MYECVFGWTANEGYVNYPPFFKISVVDGKINFTLRGEEEGEGMFRRPGPIVTARLPREQMMQMISGAYKALQLSKD